MKKNMMIVGCKIIRTNDEAPDDSIFELKLLPLTTVKAKTSLVSLAGGGFEGLMKAAAQQQQLEDQFYITLGEWKNRGYRIGRHVTLELLPDDSTGGIE